MTKEISYFFEGCPVLKKSSGAGVSQAMGTVMATTYSGFPYSLTDQMRQNGGFNRSVRRGQRQEYVSKGHSRPRFFDVLQDRVANIALKGILLYSAPF
jgi:hypothetical protein